MLLTLLPFAVVIWLMFRGQKKKEQQRRDLLSKIQKGDHVVTVGGLHGEVVRLNEKEVVLLVDKSKNVELRFQRVSIAGLAGEKDGEQGTDTKQEGGSK
jgi:preprotein translocase subunit YajC